MCAGAKKIEARTEGEEQRRDSEGPGVAKGLEADGECTARLGRSGRTGQAPRQNQHAGAKVQRDQQRASAGPQEPERVQAPRDGTRAPARDQDRCEIGDAEPEEDEPCRSSTHQWYDLRPRLTTA